MQVVRRVALVALTAILAGCGGDSGCPPDICQRFVWVEVDPPRQTAQVGQTVSFRSRQSGTVGVEQYQWCRYAPGGSTCVRIEGAREATLTVAGVSLADDKAVYEVTAIGSGAVQHTDSGELLVVAAPVLDYQDGEFFDGDWTWHGFSGFAPGVSSDALGVWSASSSGNPGAHRVVSYGPITSGDRMFATHLASRVAYDPKQQGAIYSIDFSAQCKALSGYGVRMSVRPLIRQGSRTYTTDILYAQYCEGPGWNFENDRGSIVMSDFSQVLVGPPCGQTESCPDFSADGAPITFGMLTVNDHVDVGPAGTASQGIDNWRTGVWRR